jgi:hypothetical protein
VYNYTRGFNYIWNEIAITLTPGSDWNAAREIMLSTAQESAGTIEQEAAANLRRMSHEYHVHFSTLTPYVYVRLVPDGIRLTLRYLCEVRKRRGTEHAMTIQLLQAFKSHPDIELTMSTPLIVSQRAGLAVPGWDGELRAGEVVREIGR